MKKLLLSISAVIISLFSLTGCSLTESETIEVENKTDIPTRMLFLGDSIASGYGLNGYSDEDKSNCNSYANILHESYAGYEFGNTMINKSVPGATSKDLLELVDSGALDEDLRNSDAVVVSIGGNDMLGTITSALSSLGYNYETSSFDLDDASIVSAGLKIIGLENSINDAIVEFEKNLGMITSSITSRTKGTVYIQTVYDPFQFFSSFDVVTTFTAKEVEKLNFAIFRNAGTRYKVVDIQSEFKGREGELTMISKLDIHPNEQGHMIIAQALDNSFRSTGFTYITEEQGPKHLSSDGKKVIIIGSAGLILLIIVFAVSKKSKKSQ